MAVPLDWSITFARQHPSGAAGGVSDARAICPHCDLATFFTVVGQHYVGAADYTTKVYLFLMCNYRTCRKITFVFSLQKNGCDLRPDDPFFTYPSRSVQHPHISIPAEIAADWEEAQRVMQASAPKAAAVMLRRVLYGVLIDKGCGTRPLDREVAKLIQQERLPAMFDNWLPAIGLDGMDGAHPDRALQVSAENVGETLEYTSELLRYLYVEPFEFEERKKRNTAAMI